jgi:hypothetical protein
MLLSIFALSTFNGCELFEDKDDMCSRNELEPSQWFSVISNNYKYTITVNNSAVSTVKLDVSYAKHSCGVNSPAFRTYYTVNTKTFSVKPPQTLSGMLSGYYCSTEIRNKEDGVALNVVIQYISSTGKLLNKKVDQLQLVPEQMWNNGEDFHWWPEGRYSY